MQRRLGITFFLSTLHLLGCGEHSFTGLDAKDGVRPAGGEPLTPAEATPAEDTPTEDTGGGTSGHDEPVDEPPVDEPPVDEPPVEDTGSGSDPAEMCPTPDYDKPGPENTGPFDESILVDSGSLTVTEDWTVIENVHVNGRIKVEANHVTIRNAIIDCADANWYGVQTFDEYTDTIIEHVEIVNCKSAGIYGPNFHASYLEVHEMWADGVKAHSNTTLQYSWMHHLGKNEGAHADGNQTREGVNIVLHGNFFDMPIPESDAGPGSPYDSNANTMMQAAIGNIDSLIIDGNWMNGGNYTVYLTGDRYEDGLYDLANAELINNRFGRDYRYGVLALSGPLPDLTIACNRWDDTGELMDIND
jgi:hypothetical protein